MEEKKTITIDVDLNYEKSCEAFKEELEKLVELSEEIEFPITQPIINFYGCSFNFANDGCAEARYYNGDDVYNPRKEE